MSPRVPIHGIEILDGYIARTRDFMNDWLRFNQLLGAYTQPSVNRLQLETHFLQLKSKLARDHRVLSDRLGPDCKFTLDVINIISSATSLENIFAQSDVAVKKLQNEWHRSFITVNETLGNLEDKHKRAEAGERVNVGGLWIQAKIKKPFPWKTVIRYGGGAVAVLLVLFTVYFMRNFLGFWAPGAGDGMAITANMTDEEKLHVMISTMKAATEAGDIDMMMTAFADNFSFEQGGKTEVRALLQAYKVQGGFEGAVLDTANANIQIDGDKGKFAPVEFIGPRDQVTLAVVGERNGDRWLITGMAGLQ
ncbi:MAG: hypothetical protein IT366_03165 [Candidatus Hydrogenedentes bacterium]|nr:hypothetical protein [Candidatus Hydrogenedentota bacterium]